MEAHPGGRSPAPMRGSFPPLGQATATMQASQPQARVTPRRAKKGVGVLGSSAALRMGSGGQCCQAQPPGSRSHLREEGDVRIRVPDTNNSTWAWHPEHPLSILCPPTHTQSQVPDNLAIRSSRCFTRGAFSRSIGERRGSCSAPSSRNPDSLRSRTPSVGGGSDPYQRLHTRLPSPACVRAQVQRLECPGPAVASCGSGVPVFFLQ